MARYLVSRCASQYRALSIGAPIELRRGPAIEADEPDLGMGVEEGAKVVRNRIIRDVLLPSGVDIPKPSATE